MLELRPNCEWCDRDLAPDDPSARICTYECTWCTTCIDGPTTPLADVCPNCGGGVVPRPIRPPERLAVDPASTVRVIHPESPSAKTFGDTTHGDSSAD